MIRGRAAEIASENRIAPRGPGPLQRKLGRQESSGAAQATHPVRGAVRRSGRDVGDAEERAFAPLDDLDPEAGERERCEGRDDSEDGRDAGDGAEPLDAELPPPLAQSTPSETSNATHQVRRAAEAGHERTHFAVTCMRLLGRLVTSIVFCRFQYLTDYR